MENHGTSYTEGQLAKFLGAGITTLTLIAGRLGAERMKYWYDKGEAMQEAFLKALTDSKVTAKPGGVFTITCDGSYIASELVRRGKYDWVNDLITDKRFPIKEHAPQTRTIELVEVDYDPTSEEMLRELKRRGLERPTSEDALYFGIQHPDEQRKHPIVFLHDPVEDLDGYRRVLVLDGGAGGRGLSLGWFGGRWPRHGVFAGVRK